MSIALAGTSPAACRKLAAWALALLLPASAFAGPHRVVDLRNQSDASGEYEISFCARPSPAAGGLPGHAFVAFSHLPASGARAFTALGHTTHAGPVRALLSYGGSFSAPGVLQEERYTAVKEACLVVKVNQPDYERALSSSQPVLTKLGLATGQRPVLLAYSLGAQDCMGYMMTVARGLRAPGLTVPPRGKTELPLHYLRRFIDAN